MEVNEAYQTLKHYLSKEFIEDRTTEDVLLSAENSWLMPLPWFFAATAYARDGDKEQFEKALKSAAKNYAQILEGGNAKTKIRKEAEATDTLAGNAEKAWELVRAEL